MLNVVGRHECFQPVVENQVSPELREESEKLKAYLQEVKYMLSHGAGPWASVATIMELDHSFMQRRVGSREIERVTLEDVLGIDNGVRAVVQGNPAVGVWRKHESNGINEHMTVYSSQPNPEMQILIDTRSHTLYTDSKNGIEVHIYPDGRFSYKDRNGDVVTFDQDGKTYELLKCTKVDVDEKVPNQSLFRWR